MINRWILSVLFVVAVVAASSAFGQPPDAPLDREAIARTLREMHAELEATKAKIARLEQQIRELAALLGEDLSSPANPVTLVRLDDEEHEFNR